MTRQGNSLKDSGHYPQKIIGYTALALLIPVILFVILAEKIEPHLDKATSRLHRWMRPCLYVSKDLWQKS